MAPQTTSTSAAAQPASLPPATPHILVVGAGIVGASIAWHAAVVHRARVTVVSTAVGGTATPNSFAWLNANFNNPRSYYDFRYRSLQRWHALADDGTTVPGLRDVVRWAGNLQWEAASPEELEHNAKQHTSWGYAVSRVQGTEALLAREPWLAESVLPASKFAVELADEGSVEASEAAKIFVKNAQAHGAEVVHAEVVRLVLGDDRETVQGLVTSEGKTITADHVVLAAGLGTVPLSASVGVKVPVSGRAGLLVHSKPVPIRLLQGSVISTGPHIRQTVEGRLLSGANFAGTNPGEDPQAKADALFAQVQALFRPSVTGGDGQETALPPLELDYYTIGYRPDPQDGLPILGASGRPGLTLAVMHSGVTLAAVVGELISDLVVNGREDADLAQFALTRFDKKTNGEANL